MKQPSKCLPIIFCAGILGGIMLTLPPTPPPTTLASPFVYSFNAAGVLNEASSAQESTSPYFWLDSGGELLTQNGFGSTMQGDAPPGSAWRALYARDNPRDTDGGLHPQNLFRLVIKSSWGNVSEQAQFFIMRDELSTSTNRNASNGLLLMSRYGDRGQTLYYAGVRVDGTAVIKKKINGAYYTMAQTKVFSGAYSGTQDSKNLIPHQTWIGLRSTTATNADGSVTVALFMQLPDKTAWTNVLSATDRGQYGATAPILGPGFAGIRTDFMDVVFESYRLERL